MNSRIIQRIGLTVAVLVLGSGAAAQTSSERLGALLLSIDDRNWRIERSAPNTLTLVPIGAMAKDRRPVVVSQATSNDCDALARAVFSAGPYNEPKKRMTEVGGVSAIVMEARTGCRNATPLGIAICIPHKGMGYVLSDRIAGCRSAGGNPFSANDGLAELAKGIKLEP